MVIYIVLVLYIEYIVSLRFYCKGNFFVSDHFKGKSFHRLCVLLVFFLAVQCIYAPLKVSVSGSSSLHVHNFRLQES